MHEFGQNVGGVDHQWWKSNSDFPEDNPLRMVVIPGQTHFSDGNLRMAPTMTNDRS